MKQIFTIISIALFAVNGLFAQGVVTTTNVNLRSTPGLNGAKILTIAKGTRIVLHDCIGNWCQTSINGRDGYILRSYTESIDNNRKVSKDANPTSAVKYYTNSRGERVQSPTHYDKAPTGATAQCRDGSYSFSRSRRGTCSHHGGVARWLK